jgi:hypothetical protein
MGEGSTEAPFRALVSEDVDVPERAGRPLPIPSFDDDLPEVGPADAGLLADLDEPNLVFSEGYVGPERRGAGLVARLRRATFAQRRSMLRLEMLVAAAAVLLVIATLVVTGGGVGSRSPAPERANASRSAGATVPSSTTSPRAAATPTTGAPSTTAPSTTAAAPAPTVAAAAPATPPTTAAPAPAPAPASAAASTPSQLGAQALTLVRYPWQSIPGYSIQFEPISDAPSPGFYGNTDFTWGRTGGTSTLYVYPGETVSQLAGIIAFEIAHEVDAAAVEPEGGETQIENILGIHPASWAPNCDCAEQNFLSGWYAATFSNYWSPGVGDWSSIAPEPTGGVLAAVAPWLNPTIP